MIPTCGFDFDLAAIPPFKTTRFRWRDQFIFEFAVLPEARGAGVGTDLIAACRHELRNRGIEYWAVGYVEANHGAQRLYEREGFRPYYRNMLGRVDSGEP